MKKLVSLILLGIGVCAIASAIPSAPEIDPASGMNAVALVGGLLLVLRSRKK